VRGAEPLLGGGQLAQRGGTVGAHIFEPGLGDLDASERVEVLVEPRVVVGQRPIRRGQRFGGVFGQRITEQLAGTLPGVFQGPFDQLRRVLKRPRIDVGQDVQVDGDGGFLTRRL